MTIPSLDPAEREQLILEHMPLVRALARRYANRGEPLDDLEQAGAVGLIKAVDRFDASRRDSFRAFAATTILGEIRRHFRDRTWSVRVSRGLKDDYARVASAIDQLTMELGRSPRVPDIAERLGMTDEQVLEAIDAHAAYRPKSISEPATDADDDAPGIEIADHDPGFELAEGRASLREGLAALPARERVILHLRFEEDMIQTEIAAIMGISQMHVSRLISRALETLRHMSDEGGGAR